LVIISAIIIFKKLQNYYGNDFLFIRPHAYSHAASSLFLIFGFQ
jgi:hypothetical protein